jgi:hypothetical protein
MKLILNLLNNPQYLRLHTALWQQKKKLSVEHLLIVEKKYLHITNTLNTFILTAQKFILSNIMLKITQ